MLSFIKNEPPYRLKKKTSVLDDQRSQKEKVEKPRARLGQPMPKRRKVEKVNWKLWPFDWDWSGLYCHDLPLLELPDTVLLDVLRLVNRDERIQISYTCGKLRNLFVNNQSADLDRRRTISECFVVVNDEPFEICFDHRETQDDKDFDNYHAFEEFVKEKQKRFFVSKIDISIPSNRKGEDSIKLSQIVECLEGLTDKIKASSRDMNPSSDVLEELFTAFLNYSHVEMINMGYRMFNWAEYCNRVAQWAIDNGWAVRRAHFHWRFFQKKREEGRKEIVFPE